MSRLLPAGKLDMMITEEQFHHLLDIVGSDPHILVVFELQLII